MQGTLLIISGPSGSGKGTLVEHLLRLRPEIRLSVSVTTRQPRPGEEEGVHYFFVTHERFREMVKNGELLEHASYCGEGYGTPKAFVEECLRRGEDVLLEIEPQGALQVMKRMPDAAGVFVVAPSPEELLKRLRGRMSEPEEVIQQRLEASKGEFERVGYYRYVVVNDDPDLAAGKVSQIVTAERCRRENMTQWINEVYLNA